MMEKKTISTLENAVILSEIATIAGAIMLANGAEIYRVEDTVERIVKSKINIKDVDVYSTSNVIILSFSFEGEVHTNLRRVKTRRNNLYFIDKANTFSREFVSGKYTLKEALIELDRIKSDPGKPVYLEVIGSGLSAAAFLILLGGTYKDMPYALIVGFISYIVSDQISRAKFGFFLINFVAGLSTSLMTMAFFLMVPGINFDKIVISALMAFLPGITLTNAMRDLLSGDATSGLTGAVTAILVSSALALGAALPITLFTFLR